MNASTRDESSFDSDSPHTGNEERGGFFFFRKLRFSGEQRPHVVLTACVTAALLVGGAGFGVSWWVQTRGVSLEYLNDIPDPILIGHRKPQSTQPGAPPFDLSNLQIEEKKILSGGPQKDGIPSLTEPPHVPAAEAEHMKPDDRVVGVTVGGESRAYPLAILAQHEIVNDTLGAEGGGEPIAVVFCPLCDSVTVVDRRLNGATYEFGVSGRLVNSNVLFYDRTDDALWSQVGMQAISGPNAGASLRHLSDWSLTSFGQWKNAHPNSTVLSFGTGAGRNYRATWYERYFKHDDLMFPVDVPDKRFANKYPVVGVDYKNNVRAYPVEAIAETDGGAVRETIGDGVIELRADVDGAVEIVQAPPSAKVIHTFWFAWSAFYPETTVYEVE